MNIVPYYNTLIKFRPKSKSVDALIKLISKINYNIGFQIKDIIKELSIEEINEEITKMHESKNYLDIFILCAKIIGKFDRFIQKNESCLILNSGTYFIIDEWFLYEENDCLCVIHNQNLHKFSKAAKNIKKNVIAFNECNYKHSTTVDITELKKKFN